MTIPDPGAKPTARLQPLFIERLVSRWANWAIADEAGRVAYRQTSTYAELKEFYEYVFPHVVDLISYLDEAEQCTSDGAGGEVGKTVKNLLLMLCEVDSAVNKWKAAVNKLGVDNTRFTVLDDEYAYKGMLSDCERRWG